jgi:hypothetical protein
MLSGMGTPPGGPSVSFVNFFASPHTLSGYTLSRYTLRAIPLRTALVSFSCFDDMRARC